MLFVGAGKENCPHAARDLFQRHIVVFLPGSNTEGSFWFRKETFYNKLLLRKYSTRMYLNASISVAPRETDRAISSNGAVTYPIKHFHGAADCRGSVSSAEKEICLEGEGRFGVQFLLQGLSL